jgi:hypothetical protein
LIAGWAVTYGTDEEALERKLRENYGNEINQVEGRKAAMSQVYQSLIKNQAVVKSKMLGCSKY